MLTVHSEPNLKPGCSSVVSLKNLLTLLHTFVKINLKISVGLKNICFIAGMMPLLSLKGTSQLLILLKYGLIAGHGGICL